MLQREPRLGSHAWARERDGGKKRMCFQKFSFG
jgi:hypothetical protein